MSLSPHKQRVALKLSFEEIRQMMSEYTWSGIDRLERGEMLYADVDLKRETVQFIFSHPDAPETPEYGEVATRARHDN